MSVSNEIKDLQIQGIVKDLLTSFPMYRDSDKKLCARIWSMQMGGTDTLKKLSAYDFLVEYTKPSNKSVLFSQESVGRARRKLQELHPELRGVKYKERQTETKAVRTNLGYKN